MKFKKLFTLTLFMIMAVGIKDGYAAYPLTAKDITDGNVFEETDFDGLAAQSVNEIADVDNINDCSNDNTEFQTTKDLFANDTEVRPVNATEEFQGLREVAAQNSSIPSAGWYKYQELTVITTNATLSLYVNNYVGNCTNNCVFSLKSAAGNLDKRYWIKNNATTTITIDANSSETIDGSATYILGAANTWVSIISDGVNWHITARDYSGLGIDYYAGLEVETTSVTTATIAIDYVTVSSGGNRILLSSVSETVDITSSGAGGLDVGSEGNDNYYIWIIYNPTTATVDGLISSSPSAPSMPTDYTYKRLVSYISNRSSDLLEMYQFNNDLLYTNPKGDTNVLNNGGSGSFADVATSDYSGDASDGFAKMILLGASVDSADGVADAHIRPNGSTAGAGKLVVEAEDLNDAGDISTDNNEVWLRLPDDKIFEYEIDNGAVDIYVHGLKLNL